MIGFISKNNRTFFTVLLIVYIIVLLCLTVIFRDSPEKNASQTEWLWGYYSKSKNVLLDNLWNFLVFVPIGLLVSLIVPKYRLLISSILGLFVSETIECSQLIWKKGTFDVDDLFNNTAGSFVGGLIVVLAIGIMYLVRKNEQKSVV